MIRAAELDQVEHMLRYHAEREVFPEAASLYTEFQAALAGALESVAPHTAVKQVCLDYENKFVALACSSFIH